jgi:hypothetical protein
MAAMYFIMKQKIRRKREGVRKRGLKKTTQFLIMCFLKMVLSWQSGERMKAPMSTL